MKDKTTALLLWLFLGVWGAHKFYLGKPFIGILYLFTFGFFFIGWFIDIFSLYSSVDLYNSVYGRGANTNHNNNVNNIVVNVPHTPQPFSAPNPHNMTEQIHKLGELKEKGLLSEEEFQVQKNKLLN